MQNNRITDNGRKQNEDLYLLKQLESRGRWNRGVVGDYYIRQSNRRIEDFTLSKTKLDMAIQTCIIVVDENIITTLESIDWNRYVVSGIGGFLLNLPQIHHAFNENYNAK